MKTLLRACARVAPLRHLQALRDTFTRLYIRLALAMPRPKRLVLVLLLLSAATAAFAPAAFADGSDKYKPAGIGDLMPSPITVHGQGTLFESYDTNDYTLDMDFSTSIWDGDPIDGALYDVCEGMMMVIVTLGRAAVVLTEWCFKVVSLPPIETALSNAISGAAGPMLTMFLPAAVGIGAFLAWAKRGSQSVFGQLAWVAASAAIATTFFTAPATWVKGVDNGRQLGSSVAMDTIGSGLNGGNGQVPFKTPTPTWGTDDTDNTIREASDAVWRTYVAVPWCIADLGSLNACQTWGKGVLDHGTDMDARKSYLSDNMTTDAAGSDAVDWRKGKDPGGRIAVLFIGIVTVAIFCVLLIGLAFATLASLLGALMLLVCGVGFASMWCIPGKPRQWGVQWFELLLGLVMVSFTSTMLLGAVMVVSVAMMSLLPTYGWLAVAALNICATVMAWKVKGRLDGIVSASGAQMAGRSVMGTVGRAVRSRRLRRAISGGAGGRGRFGDMDRRPSSTPGSGPSSSGPARGRNNSRTFPAPPSRSTSPAGAPPSRGTAPGSTAPPGTGPGRSTGPHRGPGPGPAPGRSTGTARRTGGTTSGTAGGTAAAGTTAGGYRVRPGAPSGPPPSAPGSGTRVISGTVLGSTTNPTGARFRSYPPPPSGHRPPSPPSGGRPSPPPSGGRPSPPPSGGRRP